jgi:hypothetical protein
MKLTDYIRLGRLSIKARKKSTKNTVFGMSFGLILIVPMVFFAMAFYMDLTNQVNSFRTASQMSVEMKNINDPSSATEFKEGSRNSSSTQGMPAFSSYEDLIEMEGLEEYILYEYCNLNFMYFGNDAPILNIEGDSHDYSTEIDSSRFNGDNNSLYGINKLKIIFTEESSQSMFTDAEKEDFGKNPLLSICNDGFTKSTDGKGEIIVSEYLLDLWDIDKEDIADEEITITYKSFQLGGQFGSWGYYMDNDYNPNNDLPSTPPDPNTDPWYETYFCYQFKVVGIIDEEYYNLPGKDSEAHLWVTAASVYYPEDRDDYSSLDYTLTRSEDKGMILTLNDDVDDYIEINTVDGYMFLLQTYADKYQENQEYSGGNYTSTFSYNTMHLTMQFSDYAGAQTAIVDIKTILSDAYEEMTALNFTGIVANEMFMAFQIIDMIGKIIIIVFSAIGGIIFFTNMLNLLNTVRYSVESRKNFIGVLRAIGAKSKVIPRMYIWEMMIIFFKTFIWTAIFGTIFSLGIKLLLDYAFKQMGEMFSFTINFIYYPVALGGAMALTIVIGILFAYVSSKVMAYQPILKTLYDEK